MARATLTVQTLAIAGTTPSFAAADTGDGNQFVWPGKPCWVEVKNTGSINSITIATPMTVQGLALADVVVSVPATTGDKIIPLTDASLFVQADGYVYINGLTGMTIGVFTLP